MSVSQDAVPRVLRAVRSLADLLSSYSMTVYGFDGMVTAHVHNNHHFVLLTSWNDALGQFNVNDPFYNSTVSLRVVAHL